MIRLFATLCLISMSTLVANGDPTQSLLNEQIRGLLAERCYVCHGPDVQEAGLRLDQRDAATAQLDSGDRAIVPGDLQSSMLLHRVTSTDEADRMPPEGPPLDQAQIASLQQWIQAAAPYDQHWAYTPLALQPPPSVEQSSWIHNPIDAFVLSKLQSRELSPSPPADRYTLIRRAYYDLIGLPPDPQAVEDFVTDELPNAYEKLVDHLLESQHFGERWGRHWLDKARYADSDGYEKDRPRPNAWRYRDWVIDAINRDLPIDQFTIEQLAGDLLPDATEDQRLATAFHRQTLTNTEGGVDQEEFRVEAVFDRTETTGAIWLGLTVGCARCHTHKYDAITQDEYYRLFAFFNSGDETSIKLPRSDAAMRKFEVDKASHDAKVAALQQQIESNEQGFEPAFADWQSELASQLRSLEPLESHDLEVSEITSTVEGVTFERQEDGSVLVGGTNPDEPVDYIVHARASIDHRITGVRIDTPADKRLPASGPGRTAHGNFVLSELQLSIDEAPVVMVGGEASFAQGGFPPSEAIDGDLSNGWAVSPQMGKSHHASFGLQDPVSLRSDQALTFRLRQHYSGQHSIGKFRLRLMTGFANLDQMAPQPIRELLMLASQERSAKQALALKTHFLRHEYAATKSLHAELERLLKASPAVPMIDVRVITQRKPPRETKVFDRGVFLNPLHNVQPGVFATLPPIVSREGGEPDRLDLARWLFSDQNALTARVLANHVWRHLFGEGIVRSMNDFGVRGQAPTHRLLLDWLAAEYRREGWSRKRLIKTIMMSSTYRQASHHRSELLDVDAENRLLARQNRFRVSAEIVRDLSLSVAGLLSTKIGGPSVFPPLPADVAALSYANSFKWQTSPGEDRLRRGMYTFFKRTAPHPNLITFDCPDSNTTSVARRVSNTPLQALTILNNEVYFEAAQGLAARTQAMDSPDDVSRITAMLQRCIARPPSDFEIARFVDLLQSSRAWYAANPDEAKQLASAHQNASIDPLDAAAWIAVARIVLNLDEFITRE